VNYWDFLIPALINLNICVSKQIAPSTVNVFTRISFYGVEFAKTLLIRQLPFGNIRQTVACGSAAQFPE
jgi:hypothetical protein